MAAARRAVLAAAFALFTIFDALIFVPLGGENRLQKAQSRGVILTE